MIPNRPHSMNRYMERFVELSAPLVKAKMKMFGCLVSWKRQTWYRICSIRMLTAPVRNCANTTICGSFDIHMPCHQYDPGFELETRNYLFNSFNYTWDFHGKTHIPKVLEISRSTSCKTFLVLDPQRCVLPWLGHGEVLKFGKFGPCTNINMSQLQPPKI